MAKNRVIEHNGFKYDPGIPDEGWILQIIYKLLQDGHHIKALVQLERYYDEISFVGRTKSVLEQYDIYRMDGTRRPESLHYCSTHSDCPLVAGKCLRCTESPKD